MKKNYLRIEGEAVQIVQEEVLRTVDLNEFAKNLAMAGGKISTPVLPAQCRLFVEKKAPGGTLNTYVIEQPPALRNITWQTRKKEMNPPELYNAETGRSTRSGPPAPPDRRKLAFPFVIFVVALKNGAIISQRCFVRRSPLNSTSDLLYNPPLPNIYRTSNNLICVGQIVANGGTPSQKISDLISKFWSAEFNTDLDDHWDAIRKRDTRMTSLETWEDSSREDPLFALSVDYSPNKTLEEILTLES